MVMNFSRIRARHLSLDWTRMSVATHSARYYRRKGQRALGEKGRERRSHVDKVDRLHDVGLGVPKSCTRVLGIPRGENMAHEVPRLCKEGSKSQRSLLLKSGAKLTVISANASHAILVICTATTSSGNSIKALLKSTKIDAEGIPFFQLLLLLLLDELKLLAGSFESTVSMETASELLLA